LATGRAPAADDLSPISGIPKNWNRSHYNKARYIKQALEKLITTIPASFLLISFNSEGFINPDEMENLLTAQGKIQKLECNYNTFRGSRNLHNRNIHVTEYLYVVDKR
jgi:adenine-specific DNA-methyltransferase